MRIVRQSFIAIVVTAAAVIFRRHADGHTRENNRNRAVIEKAFQAWRDGKGGPYELLAENVNWTITGRSLAARTYPEKESFMGEVIRPFNARMLERLVPTKVHELVVDGDRIVIRFDAAGVATDGQSYVNTYAWFLTIQGDRIVNAVAFFDSIAFEDLCTRVVPSEPAVRRRHSLVTPAFSSRTPTICLPG